MSDWKPLRIAFVNPAQKHDYNVNTAFEQPLAGTESAQCYLCAELARKGHTVFLLTGTTAEGLFRGVNCLSINNETSFAYIRDFDAFIINNNTDFSRKIRNYLGTGAPIFSWMQNVYEPSPASSNYIHPPAHDRDYLLCVSNWQINSFLSRQAFPPEKIFLLGNAVSPFFENLYEDGDPILPFKAFPPTLAFASAAHKGLEPALHLFQILREHCPSAILNIFSDYRMYPPANSQRLDKSWDDLFDRCRRTQGVNTVGSVERKFLARGLKSSLILFYPCVWEETAGISVMEAIAAGCFVVTTAGGALPETLAGFGKAIALDENNNLTLDEYIRQSLIVLEQFLRNDQQLESELKEQVRYVHRHYRWELKAEIMESVLFRILGGSNI